MAAVGVPPVMVGVAKRLFYVLSMCPIADNAATQQVVFVVFCTIIFLSGLSFRYLYIQPLIRLSVARYNRLFNSMPGAEIMCFILQSTDILTVSLFAQTCVCTYNHHVACPLRDITVCSIPCLAMTLSVSLYNQLFLYLHIRLIAIVRFIKIWKYGTFPVLIDITLSVYLLTA
jgi:hypothetical protein